MNDLSTIQHLNDTQVKIAYQQALKDGDTKTAAEIKAANPGQAEDFAVLDAVHA